MYVAGEFQDALLGLGVRQSPRMGRTQGGMRVLMGEELCGNHLRYEIGPATRQESKVYILHAPMKIKRIRYESDVILVSEDTRRMLSFLYSQLHVGNVETKAHDTFQFTENLKKSLEPLTLFF